ncbi:MAG: glycosyltransferase family 2 protein [Sandaracinaceae bacterium]
MSTPLVSVILPVYDVEPYLGEALSSLRRQTLADLEVLAVNDGSHDQSGAILDEWASRWPALTVIHRANGGAASARNLAIDRARGRYIALQDADDASEPDRLARQVELLERHPEIGLVGTDARLVDPEGRHLGLVRQATDPSELEARLSDSTPLCHPSLVFRRACFDAGHRYNAAYANVHDYDLMARVMRDFQASNVPEPLYRLRVHGDQLSVRFLETGGYRGLAAIHLARERREPPFSLGQVTRDQVLSLGLSPERIDETIVGRYRYWLRVISAGGHPERIAALAERGLRYVDEHAASASTRAALHAEVALASLADPRRSMRELGQAARLSLGTTLRAARQVATFHAHRVLTDPERPLLTRLEAARHRSRQRPRPGRR